MRKAAVAVLMLMFMAKAACAESCDALAQAGSSTRRDCVYRRLQTVMDSLNQVKLALSLYFQNYAGFPGMAETIQPGMPGEPPARSLWEQLGYSAYPPLPPEVASLSYVPLEVRRASSTAESFVLVITLRNISPQGIDGQQIGISPADDVVITGPDRAVSRSGALRSASALSFHYSCHSSVFRRVDRLVMRFFRDRMNAPLGACK